MKLKKILLPIFIGVAILSASFITVMANSFNRTNIQIENSQVVDNVAGSFDEEVDASTKDASSNDEMSNELGSTEDEQVKAGVTLPTYSTFRSTIASVSGVAYASITTLKFKSSATSGYTNKGTLVTGINVYVSGTKVELVSSGTIYAPADSQRLFYGWTSLTSITFDNFSTDNVTYMGQMFNYCSSLTSLDVSSFNTSNVTNMSGMFSGCSALTSLDLSGFNTSNVTKMEDMFSLCSGLTTLDVSSFDTSKVTNMSCMFSKCGGLTSLALSSFNTSNVTNMSSMFSKCGGLTSLDLSNFDTSNVEYMDNMFYDCRGLTSLDLSGWNTENVTEIYSMFYGCSGLTFLDISSFDISKVTTTPSRMLNFGTSNAIQILKLPDAYNVALPISTSSKLSNGSGTVVVNGTSTTSIPTGYAGQTLAVRIELPTARTFQSTLESVSGISFPLITSLKFLYEPSSGYTYKGELVPGVGVYVNGTDVEIVSSGIIYAPADSSCLFYDEVDDDSFAGGSIIFDNFNTSKVTNMYQMFRGCFKAILDVSGFDTSNVTDMSYMFYGCGNVLGLSSFDTSKVTRICGMLCGHSETTFDLSSFNTSKVTDMAEMFQYCTSLTSLDISSFDTSNVTFMSYMFEACHSLTSLDLSSFDMTNVTYVENMLNFGTTNAIKTLKLPSVYNVALPISTSSKLYDANGNLVVDGTNITEIPVGYAGQTLSTRIELPTASTFQSTLESVSGISFPLITSLKFLYEPSSGYTYKGELVPGVGVYVSGTDVELVSSDTIYAPADSQRLFYGWTSLTSITFDNFSTDNITYMGQMFNYCSSLTSLDVSSFNTSNVTNMSGMFSGCSALTSLDLSGWDTSNVTNMSIIFFCCEALTSLDVSSFNTSNVTNMGYMFNGCRALTSLDVSSFNTSNVTNMYYMFDGCSALTSLDLTGFNTSNVTTMASMFNDCSALTSLDVSSFDTSKVTNMSWMFSSCSALTSLDLSGFNTSNVTNMGYMFNGCTALKELDLSSFDMSKVTTTSNVSSMLYFGETNAIQVLKLPATYSLTLPISTSSVLYNESTGAVVVNGTNTTSIYNTNQGVTLVVANTLPTYTNFRTYIANVSEVEYTSITTLKFLYSASDGFTYKGALVDGIDVYVNGTDVEIVSSGMMFAPADSSYLFHNWTGLTSIIFNNFNTSNVTDMSYMFHYCKGLTTLNVSTFNTANVTTMASMFASCSELIALDLTGFNTEKVTNMSSAFYNCSKLTTLNVSTFNTANVENMSGMFSFCAVLSSLSLSNFNTSNVTDMESMFSGCGELVSLDLSSFNTEKVAIMEEMFAFCYKLETLNISSFNTERVTTMSNMFMNCYELTSLTLTGFTTTSVTNMSYMFYNCSGLTELDLTGWNMGNVTDVTNMLNFGTSNKIQLLKLPATYNLALPISTGSVLASVSTDETVVNGTSTTSIATTYAGDTLKARLIIPAYSNFSSTLASVSGVAYASITSLKFLYSATSGYANKGALVNSIDVYVSGTNVELVSSDKIFAPAYSRELFYNWSALKSITFDNFNTSLVTDMSYMFYGCSALTSLDLSSFNTSNVTNMSYMFHNCKWMETLNVSNFNTANVTNMSYMFYNCIKLDSLDLSNFVTANVTTMSNMFYSCSGLKTLDLSSFDMTTVTTVSYMLNFGTSNNINMLKLPKVISSSYPLPISTDRILISESTREIVVNGGNTTQITNAYSGHVLVKRNELLSYDEDLATAITNVSGVEYTSITTLKFLTSATSGYTNKGYLTDTKIYVYVSGTNVELVSSDVIYAPIDSTKLFEEWTALTSITFDNFNTSTVDMMLKMFYGCSSLTTLDLSGFDTSNVKFMDAMFEGCTSLSNLKISSFNTSKVMGMSKMFYGCSSLTTLDLSNFNTPMVDDTTDMFAGCTNLISLDISSFELSDMMFSWGYEFEFGETNAIQMLKLPKVMGFDLDIITSSKLYDASGNLVVDGTNTTSISTAYAGYVLRGHYTLPIYSTFRSTVASVSGTAYASITSLKFLYSASEGFTHKGSLIDGVDIYVNGTDVEIVSSGLIFAPEDSSYLFNGWSAVTSIIFDNFNTSNVTDMSYMFRDCKKLTTLDLSEFDTSNVTVISGMFYGCSRLTSLNLTGFNTASVTSMYTMFQHCASLTSLNLSSFNTEKVTHMGSMFNNCSALTSLDLSNFNTANVINMYQMFYNCRALISLDLSSFDMSKVTESSSIHQMLDFCVNSIKILKLPKTYSMSIPINTKSLLVSESTGEYVVESIATNSISTKFKSHTLIALEGAYLLGSGLGNYINIITGNALKTDTITSLKFLHTATDGYTNNGLLHSYSTISVYISGTDVELVSSDTIYAPADSSNLFYDWTALISIDFTNFNTSNVTDMSYMFYNCYGLTALDVSSFVTTSVTNMSYMFSNCGGLTTLDVSSFVTTSVTNMLHMFRACSSLTTLDLSSFVTTSVTNMSHMFRACSSLTTLDLSNFDMTNVTNVTSMLSFGTTNAIKSLKLPSVYSLALPISTSSQLYSKTTGELVVNKTSTTIIATGYAGDTLSLPITLPEYLAFRSTITTVSEVEYTSITSLKFLYSASSGFTNIGTLVDGIDVYVNGTDVEIVSCIPIFAPANSQFLFSSWTELLTITFNNFNTSNVTSMYAMFHNSTKLQTADLSGFNTSNVTNMSTMFRECKNLTSIDVSNFDTSKVTDMGYMFSGCKKITTIDVSGWNTTNVSNMQDLFSNTNLATIDLGNFNTSNVTNMQGMFYNCPSLKSVNVSSFNTSSVTTMAYLFYNCSGLTELDLSSFDMTNITSAGSMLVFGKTNAIQTLKLPSVYNIALPITTSSLLASETTGEYIVQSTGTTSIATGYAGHVLVAVEGSNLLGSGLGNRINTLTGNALTAITSLKFTKIATSGYTNKGVLYAGSTISVYSNGTAVEIVSSGTMYAPVNSSNMFKGWTAITSIIFENFNTSNVTNMGYMFSGCSKITTIDVSGFATTNVTNLQDLFSNTGLTTVDLSKFNTENVTNMQGMFYNCRSLKSVNISSFNTSSATTMAYLFYNCSGLTELDLSSFDMSGVTTSARVTSMLSFGTTNAIEELKLPKTYNLALPISTSSLLYSDKTGALVVNGTSTTSIPTTYQGDVLTLKKYTITADGQGGTFGETDGWTVNGSTATKRIMTGNEYGVLPSVTREGYTFNGWYTASTGGTAVAETDMASADVTIYAQWIGYTYTVVFNGNGHTGGSMANQSFTYGVPQGLRTNTYVKTNHTFRGWAVSESGEVVYTDGQSVENLTSVNGDTINLYAVWTEVYYTAKIFVMDPMGNYTNSPNVADQRIDSNPEATVTLSSESSKIAGVLVDNGIVFDYAKSSTGETITTAVIASDSSTVINFYFRRMTYGLTFNANGGLVDGEESKTETYYYGQNYGELPTPTRTGYSFNGWYTQASGGNEVTEDTLMGTSNTTIFAQWTIIEYTVTFDANGGEEVNTSIKVTYGSAYGTLPTANREGYRFDGWMINDGYVTSSSIVSIADNHTLMAHWTANTYTVTFDANGGNTSTTEKTVTFNEVYGDLPTPTRDGYGFNAWKLNGNIITNSSIVTTASNHTLAADWGVNTYYVKYNPNGGSGSMSNTTHTYDVAQTLAPNNFTRTGYTFLGWSKDSSATEATYEDCQMVSNLTTTANEVVNLYAVWSANTYTVELNANESTDTMEVRYIRDYLNGSTSNASSHWVEIEAYDSTETNVALNSKVTYVGTPGNYSCQLVTDGNTSSSSYFEIGQRSYAESGYVTVDLGDVYDISKIKVYHYYANNRAHYGTKTQVSADGVTWTTVYDSQSVYGTMTGKMYQESSNGHTIYLANRVSTTTKLSVSAKYNESYTLPSIYHTVNETTLQKYYREGYDFLGWSANIGATTATYTDGATIAVSSLGAKDLVLYAVWGNAHTSTLTINPNGGKYNESESNTSATQNVGSIYNVKMPSRTGYAFAGWSASNTEDTSLDYLANSTKLNSYVINSVHATQPKVYNNTQNGTVIFTDIVDSTSSTGYSMQITTNGQAEPGAGGFANNTQASQYGIYLHVIRAKIPTGYSINYTSNDQGNRLYSHKWLTSTQGTGQWETYMILTTCGQTNGGDYLEFGYMYLMGSDNTNVTWHLQESTMYKVTDSSNYTAQTIAYQFVDEDITLTANWTALGIYVNFDVTTNGGSNSGSEQTTMYYDSVYTAPSSTQVDKTGYTFKGWYTQASGGVKVFEADGSAVANVSGYTGSAGQWMKYDDDITLYAQFGLNVYTVTLDPNGGSVENSTISVSYGEAYGDIPTPSRTGYTFKGWKLDENVVTSETLVTTASNHTLIASWEINTYTVTVSGSISATTSTDITITADGCTISDSSYTPNGESVTVSHTYLTTPITITFTPANTSRNYYLAMTVNGEGRVESYDNTISYVWTPADNYTIELEVEELFAISTSTTTGIGSATFDVKYNNQTTSGLTTSTTIHYGSKVVFNATLNTGYVFDGWYEATSLVASDMTYTVNIVTKDISLTAKASENTYTITANANGGTISVLSGWTQVSDSVATKVVSYTEAFDILPTPVRTGYTFNGWYEDTNYTTKVSADTKVNQTTPADMTIYAKWTVNTYTVTLDPNGGSVDKTTLEVTYGKAYGEIPDPSRTGYTFKGWKLDGNVVTSESLVTTASNHTLTASWEINTYTLTVEYYDFMGLSSSEVEKENNNVELALGFSGEIGWNYSTEEVTITITKPSADTKDYYIGLIDVGSKVVYGYNTISFTWTPSADAVVEVIGLRYYTVSLEVDTGATASFELDYQTANWYETFVDNEFDLSKLAIQSTTLTRANYVPEGAKVEFSANISTGYTFNGWYKGASKLSGSVEYTHTGLASNLEVTASVSENSYTITANANEGTITEATGWTVAGNSLTASKEVKYTETIGTLPTVTRKGHKFDGWYTDTNYTTEVSEASQVDRTNPQNMTIYAKWTLNEFEVTFDGNGGEVTPTSMTVIYGTVYGELATATRAGYTFNGWKLGEKYIDSGTIVETAQDHTLVAQWTANTYYVEYAANGGSGSMSPTTHTYDEAKALASNKYTRTGYTFLGWNLDKNASNATYLDGASVENLTTEDSETVTMYAVWELNTSTIKLGDLIGSNVRKVYYGTDVNNISTELTTTGFTANALTTYYFVAEMEEESGYNMVFSHWNVTNADESNVNGSSNNPVSYSFEKDGATITFTPQANKVAIGYNVTLDYQGGTDSKFTDRNASKLDYTFENGEIGYVEPDGVTVEYGISSNAFNGSKSLSYRIDAPHSTETWIKRISFVASLEVGTYSIGFYVQANQVGNMIGQLSNTTNHSSYTDLLIKEIECEPNVWNYVNGSFTISESNTVTYIMFYGDLGITYYLDDIKITRTEADYKPTTAYDYTIESEATQLPYAVKSGYTFLGWNTQANGSGEYVTRYGGGEIGNQSLYAIYKLSNPTAVTSVDNATITYGETDAVLTSNVNSEGLEVSTSYQWHVSTSENFTPSESTKISGATAKTYTHEATSKDVGTYYYRCVVTTTKDGETSKAITSSSVSVTVQQATPTLEISMTGYAYGGEMSNPSIVTNSSNGEVTYYYTLSNSAVGGIEWTGISSTTLDAGKYYMYATVEATTNYTATTSNVVEFEVSKGTMKVVISTNNNPNTEAITSNGVIVGYTRVYDGEELIGYITSNVTYELRYGTSSEYGTTLTEQTANENIKLMSLTNVGTLTYYYKVTAKNYEDVTGQLSLTIVEKTAKVEWELATSYTYNGEEQSSEVKAYITGVDGNKIYCDVAFSGTSTEFKEAGSYTATATITSNDYSLTNTTTSVEMLKKSVEIIAEDKEITYGDTAPEYTYEVEGETYDTYNVSFKVYNGVNEVSNISSLNVGTYTITPSSTLNEKNYEVTYTSGELTINAYDLANATIASIEEQTYVGREVTPEPEVTALGKKLVKGTDFTYSYANNTNAGEATITITGVANSNYTGSKSARFTIKASVIEIPVAGASPVYDGTLKTANIPSSSEYTISNNTATNAGDYKAKVTLASNNYVWADGTNTVKEVEWSILKAEVTMTMANENVSMRVSESKTNKVTLTYAGELSSASLTVTGAIGYATITASEISNKEATITIRGTKSTTETQTVTVSYAGDTNHNGTSTTFTVDVTAVYVYVVVADEVGGEGSVNNTVEGTSNEVVIGSDVTFTASPEDNYGLVKYTVGNTTNYVTSSDKLTDTYTSGAIKVTEELLGESDRVEIYLTFDRVTTINVEMEDTDNAITHSFESKIEENTVAHTYEGNELKVFESSTVQMHISAKKLGDQYYVVNKVIVNGEVEASNVLETTINKEVKEFSEKAITIRSAKVHKAENRKVEDGEVEIATVSVEANSNDSITIENAKYVVENAVVNIKVSEANADYGFVGIEVNGVVTSKDQLNANEWSYANGVHTWKNQEYTKGLSTVRPVVLEKWYSADKTNGRSVEVSVATGITAMLKNTDIGYGYTLSNNTFSSGSEPLYAGTWRIDVTSAPATGFNVRVRVYTSENQFTEYGMGQTFTVDTKVSKVEITIE